jgi:hypothetical protein
VVFNAVTPEYEAYEDDDEHHARTPDMDGVDPETYDEDILAHVQLIGMMNTSLGR